MVYPYILLVPLCPSYWSLEWFETGAALFFETMSLNLANFLGSAVVNTMFGSFGVGNERLFHMSVATPET
ncbi:hypothetical protein RIF29_12203 [Crotalaria pallida]|uniref:Uncharacterized protein n=1 Tax=Crotalaria pallida TaxID=3830 RepID=A0AAN9P1J9_CROPI